MQSAMQPISDTPVDRSVVRVLVVEDDASLRETCASMLAHEGYDVASCGRGDEARDLLRRGSFDIVLLDLVLPQVSGMELLRSCRERNPGALVILMTGHPDVETSIQALEAGAWDYLPKPFTAVHLQILVGRAAHAVAAARAADAAGPHGTGTAPRGGGVTLLGRSAPFRRTVGLAERVARTDASVFLTGESGSGKEVIAQFVHENSRRSARPLVAVNCAALPETLLESELFGHVRGAFTGAVRDKPGLLETADGGTFFLDELTEMSLPIQAKLLRVIQDGIVRRVGSESTDARVNVRFIAATNRDPKQAVQEGHLRMDLYYRLGVVPIRVPALRERTGDIPLLAEHFLSVYWRKHRGRAAPLPRLTDAALRSLQARPWSGNVRELQNVVEHAVVFLEPGQEILPEDLPGFGSPCTIAGDPSRELPSVRIDQEYHAAREHVLSEFEAHYLSSVLDRAGANMSQAARIAGVDRTTLYRLMEKHGLQRDAILSPA